MNTFTDNMHQKWNLSLSLLEVRTLREKLGLDLLNPEHYLQVSASLTDRLAFVYLLCEKQAKEYEVSVEEFEERLMGDGFATAASNAFIAETEAFFQRLGQHMLAGLARKNLETMKMGQQKVDEMVQTGQLDSLLDDAGKELMEVMLPANDGNGS